MLDTTLSTDGQALLLLCSSLGLPTGSKPLTTGEWNRVAGAMAAAGGLRPADLLSRPASSMCAELGLSAELGDRIAALLERGGQLALELERLASRGIWVVTRADGEYPQRLKDRLRGAAPPVLFGAGRQGEWQGRSIAIVGSRDVDDEGLRFAERLARTCAAAGVAIVSGGARGTDVAAQEAALDEGGIAVAVLADSLERTLQKRAVLGRVRDGRLTLLSVVHPATPFGVGIAMARNKLIYCLSDAAVVIASAAGEGGTWGGAVENLEKSWVPLYVADYRGAPEGNRLLAAKGARSLDETAMSSPEALEGWLPGPGGEPTDPEGTSDASPVYTTRLTSSSGLLFDAPLPEPVPADTAPERVEPASASSSPLVPIDVYELVVEHLRSYCGEPRTADEIAHAFRLERAQVKAWLGRAVKDGTLKKLAKPVRYVAVRSLFA